MKKITDLIKNFKQVWRWMLVGLAIRIIDYFVFIFAYFLVSSIYLSNLISGLISIPLSYISHYFYTFKSSEKIKESSFRYVLRLIILWIFGTFLLKFLLQIGFDVKVIKLIAIPIMAPISYFSLKFFVFKQK
jgi:putative flippase GtrA